jgi:hypothetical protein
MADGFDWLRTLGAPDDGLPADTEEAKAEQQRQLEAMQQAERELNGLIAEVLRNGRGPELLQWLRDCTIESPLLKLNNAAGQIAGNEFPLSPAEWAYVRAGQNSVIHELERRIYLALHPAPTPAPQTKPEGNAT